MPTHLKLALLIILVGSLAPGCGTSERLEACTLIGCDSELRVVLTAPPAEPYRVEVFEPSTPSRRVAECNSGGVCSLRFVDYTPVQVTIEIITASDTLRRSATPSYAVSRPNGPQCDPECRAATVTVSP
jgi:hypothetical protein